MPTSTEKDKDVAMGDADDIDITDAADETPRTEARRTPR